MQNADIHISIFYTNHPCPSFGKGGKSGGTSAGFAAGNKRMEIVKENKRTEESRKIIIGVR